MDEFALLKIFMRKETWIFEQKFIWKFTHTLSSKRVLIVKPNSIISNYIFICWPFFKIKKAKIEQSAIMTVKGNAVPLKNTPTKAEAVAPNAIWVAPMRADAEPAPLLNGAMAMAAELGKLKPWQLKNNNKSAMVPYNPRKLK